MFEFEMYGILALLPIPLLLRWLLRPVKSAQQSSIRIPFFQDFALAQQGALQTLFNRSLWWLALLAWCLLVAAAARPQWVGEIKQIPTSGRNLILAMDLSGSMKEKDYNLSGRRVNRFQAAQVVAKEFVERRRGDRIAVVVFADHPYLLMPLSFDLDAVQEMLDETFIGLAGEKQTAIGDAMMMSLKQLQTYGEDNRVLILLTDGANNAGAFTPEQAVHYAVKEKMKVYTIGIGSGKTQRGFFSFGRGAELDEKTLKMIAKETQGRYFRARDTTELRKIYALLDEIEPVTHEAEAFVTRQSLFHYFLFASLLLSTLALVIYIRRRVV
ncbi:MAG: VWA domain-containing protein [Candidatus Oxydemutatoraceae bacterium WSBS_2016_MAG_OTU14]